MILNWRDFEVNSPSLLLGNGFSVGIEPAFGYDALVNMFGEEEIGGFSCTRRIFERLGTKNFENVLRAVYHASIVSIDNEDAINTLYQGIKSSLVSAVGRVHPARDRVPLRTISNELINYSSIFTTNYDLIPYWSILHVNTDSFVDFFWGRGGRFDPYNVEVKKGRIPIFYLHGAIHLRNSLLGEVFKTSVSDEVPDNFFEGISAGEFPLFITEGGYEMKHLRIQESPYLRFCYDSLRRVGGELVIYGHALNQEFDQHIINALNSSSLEVIYISVFSGLSESEKREFISRIGYLLDPSDAELRFFDTDTHPFSDVSRRGERVRFGGG